MIKYIFYKYFIFFIYINFSFFIFVLIFNNDPELVNFTSRALRIYMSVSCVFGIQIACQQSFIALGNAKASLFLALLRKIILLNLF